MIPSVYGLVSCRISNIKTSLIVTGTLLALISGSAVALPISSFYDLGSGKPYALIQLGNNGGDATSRGRASGEEGDKLEITSNSSVFASTIKGVDNKPEKNKISTSKVTGSWDREKGVVNDSSSSFTGSRARLSAKNFNSIAANARATSTFWAEEAGTDISVNLNSSKKTIAGAGGGANVFNVTDGFVLNSGAKLTLTGGEGDFFVFNVSEHHEFKIQSNSIIELGGDIEASEVLFNVLGNIGSAEDDGALIGGGSIFQGTLLAPGRKVEITQNHFYTFDSGDFMGTEAPETTEITAAAAIAEKEARDRDSQWGGLFGQIVAGGAINFTESDISHQPFMATPVPEPTTLTLMGIGLAGIGLARRKKRLSA